MIINQNKHNNLYSKYESLADMAIQREIIEKKADKRALIGSAIGVGGGFLLSLSFFRKNQPIKDIYVKNDLQKTFTNLKKYTKLDYEGKKGYIYMLFQALGAVIGGSAFACTVDKDKENRIEKIKEGIFTLSNVIIPTGFAKIVEHYTKEDSIHTRQGILKTISNNKILKNLSLLLALAVGMKTSLSVVNTINIKIIEPDDKKEKKLNPKDFITHIDDIIPILISSKNNPLSKLPLDRFLPLIYIALGKKTGSKHIYSEE